MSHNPVTEQQIAEQIRNVRDPELGRNLQELGMVKQIRLGADGIPEIEIELPTPAYPGRERIAQAIEAALAANLPQAGKPHVTYSWRVKGKETGGAIGLRIKNVIAVGSGKGGVGKSTVAASLAYGLSLFGAQVGLMDADVYGPSIPHLLGVNRRPEVAEDVGPDGQVIRRIAPIEVDGLKVISIGFLVAADEPIVVRGPILHRTITQFLQETKWGELDYLIIDLPPGTGDVSLTLSQLLGLAGAVVVCTPQQVALLDAVKAINMYRKVKIPVLGVVENMTGDVFGRGGAKQKAAEMNVPFLGEIPIDAQLRINGDAGRIKDNFAEGSASRPYCLHMCEQVAMQIARSLLETPTMPTLEIM
jgi:ATP-binding protein involved in chromosome partitioning